MSLHAIERYMLFIAVVAPVAQKWRNVIHLYAWKKGDIFVLQQQR